MKIKINTSPYIILISLLFFFDSGLLNSFGIPFLGNFGITTLICVIISFGLFFNCIINKNVFETIKPCVNYFWLFAFYTFVFIIAISLFSLMKYNENVYDMFICFKYFIYPFAFLPILYIFIIQKSYEELLKIIVFLVVTFIMVMTVAALLNNFFGIRVLKGVDYVTRNGRTRIGLAPLTGFAFVFSVCQMSNNKLSKLNKALYFGIVMAILFYQFYVNMTRMYIIASFVSLIVSIIFKHRPKNKQLIVCIVTFFLVLFISQTTYFNNFIESFSATSDNLDISGSTIARDLARKYFQNIVHNNPIFGMGFVSPKNAELSAIFFSETLAACLDDLGVINMWYHYGIFGVVYVVIVFARWLHLSIRLLVSKTFNDKQFIFGIMTYQLCLMPSLSVFDGQRIIMVPILWALLEYFNYKNKKEVIELREKIKSLRKYKIKFTNIGKPM